MCGASMATTPAVAAAARAEYETGIKAYFREHDLPDVFESLLTALAVNRPTDIRGYLRDRLTEIRDGDPAAVSWDMFVPTGLRPPVRVRPYWLMAMEDERFRASDESYWKAYRHLTRKVCGPVLKAWFQLCLERRRHHAFMAERLEAAKATFSACIQRKALRAWVDWKRCHVQLREEVVSTLAGRVSKRRLGDLFTAWRLHTTRAVEKARRLKARQMEGGEEALGLQLSDTISELPYALRLMIFSFLDVATLSAAAMVSRAWHEVVVDPSLWSSISLGEVGTRVSGVFLEALVHRYRTYVSVIGCPGCVRIPDGAFALLGECRNANTISLAGCPRLRDKAIGAIAVGCTSLMALDLSHCNISDVALRYLSMSCINLESLRLAYCDQLTDQGAEFLVSDKGCHRLEVLDLSGCQGITDQGMVLIAEGCTRLAKLLLNDMPQLRDRSLGALAQHCTGLTVLEMSEAVRFRDRGLKELGALRQLKALVLSGNTGACSKGMRALLKPLKRLQQLVLADCSGVDSAVLGALAGHALKSLDVCGCTAITDAGLKSLLDAGKARGSLVELDVSCCTGISDAGFLHVARAKRLARLVLRSCPGPSDLSLERVLALPTLTHLDLSGCPRLGDSSLRALGNAADSALVYLDLSNCELVTDAGLEDLCAGCPDLQTLSLAYCDGLTDEGFKHLGLAFPALKHLSLAYCEGVTDASLESLAAGCPRLRLVHLFGVTAISERAVRALVAACPALHFLSLESGFAITLDGARAASRGRPGLHVYFEDAPPETPHFASFADLAWLAP